MRKLIVAGVALALAASAVPAQTPTVKPEIRPFVGVYLPTGVQKDLFENAAMFGVQGALEMRPNFHLLGTFGYVPGQAKYAGADADVQIFQYDMGVELGLVRAIGASWQFKPFLGVGGGARTYLYADDDLRNRTCTAGYGALGAEMQLGRAALRLEGRDNVFCFRSALPGVKSRTRNDIGLSLGLAYHFR
jgi:hypothetical protein